MFGRWSALMAVSDASITAPPSERRTSIGRRDSHLHLDGKQTISARIRRRSRH